MKKAQNSNLYSQHSSKCEGIEMGKTSENEISQNRACSQLFIDKNWYQRFIVYFLADSERCFIPTVVIL